MLKKFKKFKVLQKFQKNKLSETPGGLFSF